MDNLYTIELLNGMTVNNAIIEAGEIENPVIEGDRVFITISEVRFSVSLDDYNEIISRDGK
jgi:hypothetical protein